jgi:S-adenosylmethionine:tRNA ribosyltransferase-isomerase
LDLVSTFALAALDFELPQSLEAHEPPEARGLARDGVRLLVTGEDGRHVEHRLFRELPDVLRAGDVLVANDSATLAAAVSARRADGSAVEVHFSTRLPAGLWVVEPRRVQALEDEILELPGGNMLKLVARYPDSERLWIARADFDVLPYLTQWGKPISYPYVTQRWPLTMYQTVYAGPPGSAEMPSAGRAFTPDVLERCAHRGIQFHTLTLHTGVASLEGYERPYAEEFWVPPCTAEAVNAARRERRRVIAIGTTVVRALESAAVEGDGEVIASHGWTDLVITPERGVRVVDGLLTGFHEPKASHLAMLEAIAGREHLERAYAAALGGRYLWHEFGDLHLILPRERRVNELAQPCGVIGCAQETSSTLLV